MLCFCVVDRFSGTGLYVYSELSTSVFFDDELVLETSANSNPPTTLIEDVMTSHSRVNIISFRLFASDSEQVDWKMSLHTSNNISSGSDWKCLSSATEPDCKYNYTSLIFRVQSYLILSRSQCGNLTVLTIAVGSTPRQSTRLVVLDGTKTFTGCLQSGLVAAMIYFAENSSLLVCLCC